MTDEEIIKEKYAEAVKGIMEDFFEEVDTKWYSYVIGLPQQLQVVYLVVVLDNQVFNGGFHQYFANGYRQFARETVDALTSIGATQKAALLKEALRLVNSENDPDEIFRQKLLEKIIPQLFLEDDLFGPLDSLDSLYYADEEEVIRLLGDYLRR